MKRLPIMLMVAFGLGFMVAVITVSGCSEAATRNLTIFQYQSTKTYSGPFRIDTSQLPDNAIKSQKETGPLGKVETSLTLNMDYEFEIVIRLAEKIKNATDSHKTDETPGNDTNR
ncbi:MAG: hypothetical protein KDA68_11120 [Planctomycetaceae bacterium]|nr:hypothetical protein [Planctomycetaceae bacterium]